VYSTAYKDFFSNTVELIIVNSSKTTQNRARENLSTILRKKSLNDGRETIFYLSHYLEVLQGKGALS